MARKYTDDQLIAELERVITKNLKHKHYQHTVDLAKFYSQVITGVGQAELIVQYKDRETDNQKTQRVAITNTKTPSVSNKAISVFKRVPRSDSVSDNIYYEQEDDAAKKRVLEIRERFNNFNDGESMIDYLTEAFEHYSFFDPNAWLLIELRYEKQGEKPYIYPVEISSEEAIYPKWEDSQLQYLVVKQCQDVYEKNAKQPQRDPHALMPNANQDIQDAINLLNAYEQRTGDKFILYAADFAVEYRELAAKPELAIDDEQYADAEIKELKVGNVKKRFAVRRFATKSKIAPAKQFGYIRDPETRRKTFVSPMHPARFIMRDLINSKSEYDLVKALHGFLQKIQYAPICDYEAELEGNHEKCIDGKLNLSSRTCPACNGLGLKVHKSSQDIILVKWPDGKEEFIPLDQAIHYVQVPEHMVKMWREEVDALSRDVSLAMFNTQLFDREEIAVTATEKRLNTEAANDVLFDYAAQYSAFYIFIATMAAIHTMNDEGVIIEHRISGFQLNTTVDLLAFRRLAVDAGSPYAVIQAFDMQILRSLAQDGPMNVEWLKVREKFRPLREKTQEERLSIMAELAPTEPMKVLYINFEEIMDTIEVEHTTPPFYKLTYAEQKKIIAEQVKKLTPEAIAAPEPFRASAEGDRPTGQDEDEETGPAGAQKPIEPKQPLRPNANQ